MFATIAAAQTHAADRKKDQSRDGREWNTPDIRWPAPIETRRLTFALRTNWIPEIECSHGRLERNGELDFLHGCYFPRVTEFLNYNLPFQSDSTVGEETQSRSARIHPN
jgi:hypothetical protein